MKDLFITYKSLSNGVYMLGNAILTVERYPLTLSEMREAIEEIKALNKTDDVIILNVIELANEEAFSE